MLTWGVRGKSFRRGELLKRSRIGEGVCVCVCSHSGPGLPEAGIVPGER